MKEALFYLGNISIIGYIATMVGKQLYESRKINNWQQSAQAEFETARQEMNLIRRDHLATITQVYSNQYGNDLAQQLERGIFFEDMPMILLLTSMGQPDKILDGNYKGVMTSKWYYGESTNRLGNPSYDLEISLENYRVVGWKNLK
ncbi:hypothetical protein [Spirosoma agri]|uniref:Uncharacterized protein n=1 Tax=Spirosoma agri TaxID=1987381 RepID=A0A6M0ICV5_9BACT|nr:hypothetical protein [Spirosoma agri]NEU65948.1 hypothetical protein [Spirosoma agri]